MFTPLLQLILYFFLGGTRIRKVALKVMLKNIEKKQSGTLQEDITAELKFREDMKGHKNVLVFDRYW